MASETVANILPVQKNDLDANLTDDSSGLFLSRYSDYVDSHGVASSMLMTLKNDIGLVIDRKGLVATNKYPYVMFETYVGSSGAIGSSSLKTNHTYISVMSVHTANSLGIPCLSTHKGGPQFGSSLRVVRGNQVITLRAVTNVMNGGFTPNSQTITDVVTPNLAVASWAFTPLVARRVLSLATTLDGLIERWTDKDGVEQQVVELFGSIIVQIKANLQELAVGAKKAALADFNDSAVADRVAGKWPLISSLPKTQGFIKIHFRLTRSEATNNRLVFEVGGSPGVYEADYERAPFEPGLPKEGPSGVINSTTIPHSIGTRRPVWSAGELRPDGTAGSLVFSPPDMSYSVVVGEDTAVGLGSQAFVSITSALSGALPGVFRQLVGLQPVTHGPVIVDVAKMVGARQLVSPTASDAPFTPGSVLTGSSPGVVHPDQLVRLAKENPGAPDTLDVLVGIHFNAVGKAGGQ